MEESETLAMIKRTYGKRLFGYLKPASRFDNKRGKLYPV